MFFYVALGSPNVKNKPPSNKNNKNIFTVYILLKENVNPMFENLKS
jgi:hypothetical protein